MIEIGYLILGGAGAGVTVYMLSPAATDPDWIEGFAKPGFLKAREDMARARSPLLNMLYPVYRYWGWVAKQFGFPRHRESLQADLALASFPGGFTPEEFMGFWIQRAIVFGFIAATFETFVTTIPTFNPYWFFIVLFGTLIYSKLWLSDQVNQEQSKLIRSLPNILDMISIGLDAGLDFMGAMRKVTESPMAKRDPLVSDFAFMVDQLNIGKSKNEVFEEVRKRYRTGPMSNLMTAFLQADRYGTPLVNILRIQATTMRTLRSQMAQKIANEAPVKILLPLVFIFSAVALTLFGALIVQIATGTFMQV